MVVEEEEGLTGVAEFVLRVVHNADVYATCAACPLVYTFLKEQLNKPFQLFLALDLYRSPFEAPFNNLFYSSCILVLFLIEFTNMNCKDMQIGSGFEVFTCHLLSN